MPPTATWTHAYVFSWRGSFQARSRRVSEHQWHSESSLWSSRKHLALGSHWSTGEAMTYITQDNRNMVARLCCLAEGTFEDVKGRDMNDITCLNWHAWRDLGYPTQTMNNLRGSAMYHRVTQPRMRHGARGVDGLPCRLIQLAIASDTSIVSRMAGTQVWPQREHTASGLCVIQVLLVWPFPQNVVMLQSTSVTRYCCCPETCNLNDTRPKAPLETAEQRRCRVCIGCNNAHVSHVNMVRDCLWRLWGHWTMAIQHCDRPYIINDTERLHNCKSTQHYKNPRLWESALAGSQ